MTRLERLELYAKEVHQIEGARDFPSKVNKANKLANKHKMAYVPIRYSKAFEHFIFVSGGSSNNCSYTITAYAPKLKTFEAYRKGAFGIFSIYTQHYFDRYNERLELGLGTYKERFEHYFKNEILLTSEVNLINDTEAIGRTKNGFTHIRVSEVSKAIHFHNTWFEMNEENDTEALAELREWSSLSEKELLEASNKNYREAYGIKLR